MTRPTDHELFMEMAHVAAKRSLCARDQVGAVIVSDDQVVISTGRNGPPRFYPHDEQPCTEWCDRSSSAKAQRAMGIMGVPTLALDYGDCPSLHAEANALLSAERSARLGGTIYVTSTVCFGCAKLIANSGLVSIVMPIFTHEQATARDWFMTEEFLMLLSINIIVLE